MHEVKSIQDLLAVKEAVQYIGQHLGEDGVNRKRTVDATAETAAPRTTHVCPSATVKSDRQHPTYPHGPNRTTLAERQPGGSGPCC